MHTLTAEESGVRLDVFVHQAMPELSRSFVGKLCDEKKISVNNTTQKVSYKVKQGDKVTVDVDFDKLKIPQRTIELPIIYEDNDVIVVDKPVGILSHSKGAYNPEATVATFVEPMLQDLDGERGGIVHRLDRATSGVMICAKNEAALTWLQKQFSSRKVQKTYLAVIQGVMDLPEAVIDMPIARNPKAPKTFHVNRSGKPAQTHYKTIQSSAQYSLLELKPKTGRTHQLRVHLHQQKHPIVGDTFYDGKPYERLMLHAHKLEIVLPSKEKHEFVAQIPEAFHTILND